MPQTIAPQSKSPSKPWRDLRLAVTALWGFIRSGAFLHNKAEWRRMVWSARWLAIGHLGIKEVVLPLEGMRLIARTSDHFVGCRVYMDGHFGGNEFRRALSITKERGFFEGSKPVFIDVGANIGTHSLYALNTQLFYRVLSIEPSRENYDHLSRNLTINGFSTLDAIHAAFSNTSGTGGLELSGLNFGDHRVVRTSDSVAADTPVEKVELMDFVRLMDHTKLNSEVKFMFWIDTQGHEYEVLSGISEEQLGRSIFVIEYWPALLKGNGTLNALNALICRVSDRIIVLQNGNEVDATDGLEDLASDLLKKPGEEGQLDLIMLGKCT